jgi:hypothetical protein
MDADLHRCDLEIARILNEPDVKAGTAPAWLVAMGMCDWELEKRLILKESVPSRTTETAPSTESANQPKGK